MCFISPYMLLFLCNESVRRLPQRRVAPQTVEWFVWRGIKQRGDIVAVLLVLVTFK